MLYRRRCITLIKIRRCFDVVVDVCSRYSVLLQFRCSKDKSLMGDFVDASDDWFDVVPDIDVVSDIGVDAVRLLAPVDEGEEGGK